MMMGITFAELTWDLSWTTSDGRDRTPVIPSHEVSGAVAALGPGVAGPAAGDEVFGLIEFDRNGAAADYATVPAAHLAAKPRAASHTETATVPLAGLTAWQALVDHAEIQSGDQVLVQGGAGGVGVYAVQLAAVLGGQVTATGHESDAAFIRAKLAELVDEGRLRTVVSQTFPVSDGRQAYESGRAPRPPGQDRTDRPLTDQSSRTRSRPSP